MAALRLVLRRDRRGVEDTTGILTIGGKLQCYMLEDVVRDGPKVYGKTAIPPGAYEVKWTLSNRFKKHTLQIMDVPGFAGIRIHAGNKHEDTEGCPLTGSSRQWQGARQWVSGSVAALRPLEDICRIAIGRGDRVFIDIINEPVDR